MLGSAMTFNTFSLMLSFKKRGLGFLGATTTILPSESLMGCFFSFFMRSGTSLAIRSIMWSLSASWAGAETLFLTASSAHLAFLPRFMAILTARAARSFSTFLDMVLFASISLPMVTGWAAPMFVPGAMAAMSALRVRRAPAEAALAPGGYTKTATGTGEDMTSCIIFLTDVTSPPGVSRMMRKREALSLLALFIPLFKSSMEAGFMAESILTAMTGPVRTCALS